MKPRVRPVIVVEGKYDKIHLDSFLDATVLVTDGFGIFKQEEKQALLRRLARERGLVILSDPDGAGALIRSHLHTITGGVGVIDLYAPPVRGKEKRKAHESREGLMGVEGIEPELLLDRLEKAGLLEEGERAPCRYEKYDLYRLGYCGKENSEARRRAFLRQHQLPEHLSANAFLDVINLLALELQ